MRLEKNYFPGWVRKSITFTIDDGNLVYDKRFIDIVKPYGIKGTFNLSLPDLKNHTAEFYRDFYEGFEIANHCAYHPFALTEDKRKPIADEPFNPETADGDKLYSTAIDGMWHVKVNAGWRKVCNTETYIEMVKLANAELERVFGEGSVNAFVWPYGEQKDPEIMDYLSRNFESVRKTGEVGGKTNYAIPTDMMHWSYNARDKAILKEAREYEAYSDDGELKFFCFGLHSIDYERANCWDVLEEFATTFGNRSDTYYYASVRDIFRYRDAMSELKITDSYVENTTDMSLYVKIDGNPVIIPPKSKIAL